MSDNPSTQKKSLQVDVNEQIECAHPLASRFYTDPSILEIEKEKIFRRTWQLVGTLHQACGEVNGVKRTIADPETFFTADMAGGAIVVGTDKGGTHGGVSKRWRHRAGAMPEGGGRQKVRGLGEY